MHTYDNRFDTLHDLNLLNYYQGIYDATKYDDNGNHSMEAIEYFFTWLTGMANAYDINADYDETPDGIDALYEDIETYLKKRILWYDLEQIYTNTIEYLIDYELIENKKINELDIIMAIDNCQDGYSSRDGYEYVIDRIAKNYEII